MILQGSQIAIAGMGRSGLAIAKAALARGACPTVFDEKPIDEPSIQKAVDELQAIGAEAITGWHGRLEASDYDFLVSSPGFKRTHPAIRDMLEGGKAVISEVEFAYRVAQAPIIAITGTNGKSTTTVMTWLLLQAIGHDAVLCGNISGSGYPELTLTEAALQAKKPGQVLVAEVSSFQLEWVDQFRPRVVTITNVSPDHLDRHPNFEDYLQTKLRIFSRMGEGDTVVLNDGDHHLMTKISSVLITQVTKIICGVTQAGELELLLKSPGVKEEAEEEFRVSLPALQVPGHHNLINAATAWALVQGFLQRAPNDAETQAMLKALASFRGLEHRMEFLGEKKGIKIYNNSMCTNPTAVIHSSKALSCRQHLILGGLTKDLDFGPVREYLQESNHQAYIFDQELDSTPEGLAGQLGGRWPVFRTMQEAFEAAKKAAQEGEAIMLAPGCASAWPYANFRERGEAFKALAQEWLDS